MKYTIEEIINQRIGLKPMTEGQFNKLYKVLKDKYSYKLDNSFYFRSGAYYRLFPDFIDRFGANSSSYQREGGNWNCTKEIDFEQINFEGMKYTLKQIVEDKVSIKGLTQPQYDKIIEELQKLYPEKDYKKRHIQEGHTYCRFYKWGLDYQGTSISTYFNMYSSGDSSAEITFEQIDFGIEDFLIARGGRTIGKDIAWCEFIDWLNETYGSNLWGNINSYYGVIKGQERYVDNTLVNVPIITLEDWKKRYKMEDKKIIGYKCPMDLFAGRLKSGVVAYTRNKADYTYNIDGVFKLPIEIVESWEPVYESLEEVINMGEFSITIKDGKASSGPEDITDALKRAISYFKECSFTFGEYAVNIDLNSLKFTKTGCKNTTTTYNQWLEIHKKLK